MSEPWGTKKSCVPTSRPAQRYSIEVLIYVRGGRGDPSFTIYVE